MECNTGKRPRGTRNTKVRGEKTAFVDVDEWKARALIDTERITSDVG